MVLHLNVGEYVAAFFYKPRSEKIGVSFLEVLYRHERSELTK